MNLKSHKIAYIIGIFFLLIFCLPVILSQGNTIIPAHDNVDCVNSWYGMLKQNNLLFALDEPTPCFMGMSTCWYGFCNNSVYSLVFYIFDNLTANIIVFVLSTLLSYIFMQMLLNYLVKDNYVVNTICSIIFSVLPVIPSYGLGTATMPLFFYIMIKMFRGNPKFSYKTLLLFIFPFFSITMAPGVFLMICWVAATLFYFIKYKKINYNLLSGLFILSLGFVLVDLKTFYGVLFLREPVNRSTMTRSIMNLPNMAFLPLLKLHFCGQLNYHMELMPFPVVIPVVFFVSVVGAIASLFKKIRSKFVELKSYYLSLLILLFFISLFSLLGALQDSYFLQDIEKVLCFVLPFLKGFQWGRFWMLNRVLWYLSFSVALYILLKVLPKSFVSKFAVFALAFAQLVSVLTSEWGINALYSIVPKTVINEYYIKPNGIEPSDMYISYNQMYSVPLFDKVKTDIKYNGENTAAFGFHPGILMFNGFHTIDGYLNCYPLKYMNRFRTLIEPEFAVHPGFKYYYNSSGIRMYFYSNDAFYIPTYKKIEESVPLRINAEIARKDFNLKYIISRVKIKNTEELGLSLLKSYEGNDFYNLYVYTL